MTQVVQFVNNQAFAPTLPPVNGVPQSVTNYQARAALIQAGLFASVDGAVNALRSNTDAQVEFDVCFQIVQ